MKRCGRCKKVKPFSDFSKSAKNTTDSYQWWCRKCHREYQREWNKTPAGRKKSKAHPTLKIRYGITESRYKAIWKEQNGCCDICGKHGSEFIRRLSVDHNHKTGAARALLCQKCNLALGLVSEDKDILAAMVGYIVRFDT